MAKAEDPVTALGEEILGLRELPIRQRAARARALIDKGKTVLSAAADAMVAEAVEAGTYADVAREMGVSASAINKAVTRHRRLANQRV